MILRNKSRRQTVIQHGHIKGRIRNIKGRLADNKGRLVAGLGSWSLGLSPGLPAPGLGPGPDPAWDRAQGSPGLGPRLQGPCPAHVSALLAIYVPGVRIHGPPLPGQGSLQIISLAQSMGPSHVRLCAFEHICMHVRSGLCTYMCACICAVYACICMYMHVYACICMYMHAYACLYVYACVFMLRTCMHVCIYAS